MDHQTVIDWHLDQLQSGKQAPMPEQMQAYVDAHDDLAAELSGMRAFWAADVAEETPSPQLRAGFYQMLEAHTTAQPAVDTVTVSSSSGIMAAFRGLFRQPVAQFAAYGLVFVLGYGANHIQQQPDAQMTDLRTEMNALSNMVALSLLQNPSASERLNGVAYSLRGNLADPALMGQLMTILATDESTAVRMAVINALLQMSSIDSLTDQLMELTVRETNPLVQMELCRLLLTRTRPDTQKTLLKTLQQHTLNDDVKTFVDALTAANVA